jgi:hypothetical protein
MRAVLYNPTTQITSEVNIDTEKGIEDYYKYLECSCFTVVEVEVLTNNGKPEWVSIYCDDNGLLSDNLVTSIQGYHEPLAGNLLFLGDVDEEGETLALPENISTMKIDSLLSFYGIVR